MPGRQFFALLTAAIVVMAASGFLIYRSSSSSIEDTVANGLAADASTIEAIIEARLQDTLALHRSLATRIPSNASLDDQVAWVQDVITSPQAQNLGVVSANLLVEDTPVAISGNLPELSSELLQAAQSEVVFGSVTRFEAGDTRLAIAGPVDAVAGAPAGQPVLVIEQDFSIYQSLLDQYNASADTAEALLTQRVGDTVGFISTPRFADQIETAPVPGEGALGPASDGLIEAQDTIDYRGVETLVVATAVDGVNWTLSVKIDKAEARAPIRGLRRNLALSATALLLLIALPGFVHRTRTKRRLDRIISASRSLRGGDFGARIGDSTSDQIGELAHTIDEMAGRLADDSATRTEAEADLAELALRDSLTGLPNRVAAINHLEHLLTDAEPGTVAVLFCDLDGFKAVNDGIGHNAGDKLLLAVSERFRNALRRNDYLARFGGDEFILVCSADGDLQRPRALASRLEKELEEAVAVGAIDIDVNVSIGIAVNAASDTVDMVVRNADIAMYRIKQQRKAAGAVQTSDRLYGASGRDAELQQAIAEGQMRLLYQPIVDLADNKIVGVEALVRWHHPMLGLLSPNSFLPRADRAGLLGQLDFWVFERACHQAAAWTIAGRIDESFTMSINLSPAQLANPALREHIAATIARHDVTPGILQIEITEHGLVIDDPRVSAALDELRELGIRIAIDDFGTLHANLDRVRSLSAGSIKIDQSFVTNIVHDGNDRAIIEAVLQMGTALDLRTVAEGIETAEQAEVLRELGCGYGQGYYFGNPRSPDATAHLLAYGLTDLTLPT